MILAHAVAPSAVWSSWRPDPVELALLAAFGVLYAVGARRLLASRGSFGASRAAAGGVGLVVLAVAVASPMDGLATSLFAWHMVQHLLLLLIAAPLLVHGRPVLALLVALPGPTRRRLSRLRAARPVDVAIRGATHPLVIWTLFAVALWGWHLPGPYQSAVTSDVVHVAEHAAFLGASLLWWSVVVGTTPRRRLAYGPALIFVFTTMLHGVWLAMLLSLVTTAIYPVYAAGAPLWGLTVLEDQQIAGVVMWVPTALVLLVTIGVLFLRFLHDLEARMRSAETAYSGSGG